MENDDSDVIEGFRAMEEYYKKKRKDNTKKSTGILIINKIPFESKNNGAHLIVMNRWDFWPSTGLFIDRKTGKKGRGIFNILKLCKEGQNNDNKNTY